MKAIRLLAPNGNLGSGFPLASFQRGLASDPSVIACDAGSTDSGPGSLGLGKPYFPKALYERDLVHILSAGRAHRIPVIIGSAVSSGCDPCVDFLADLARGIAAKEGLHFRLARIYSEQSEAYVLRRLAEGRVKPLWPSRELDAATVKRAVRIVGMMGCEPLMAALEGGAEVIIAGRASDTTLFAALPLLRGYPPGPVWHAAKVLECGAGATVHRMGPDCMMAEVREDHFVVWAPNPELRCSPLSVAAHTLYENSDPYFLREPSGTLITTDCRYEQVDDRSVKVSGSHFEPARPYTVKLEASELVGYHSLVIAGIRDPAVVRNLDRFLMEVRARSEVRVMDSMGLRPDDYLLNFRVYGRDAVMGPLEPIKEPAHEVGLVIEAFAATQVLASGVVSTARFVAAHNPIPEWSGMVTNLAVAYSPVVLDHGPVFRFSMNHVVEPDSPTEMFRTEFEDI